MGLNRCKGCSDLPPEAMARFRLIEGVFRDCCLKWGYQEVKTPTLEYLHLFTATGTLTPDMLGRVYSFLDWDGWSGERVVLRPDGTIPIARLYIDSLKERGLARLFYVVNTFIFEETGTKARERWQCGAELIGGSSVIANVELISLALEVLERLGFRDVEVRLCHAGLIRALLARLELSPGEQERLFDQLLDGDVAVLARLKADKPELVKTLALLLEMKGKSSGFLKNIVALLGREAAEFDSPLADFMATTDLLEVLGTNYQIDLASGRGFEYYTGVIFHLFIGDENVGGGGRYDALIPLMGGPDTPAAGFALYLDRLMNLVGPEAPAKSQPGKRVLILAKPETVREAFAIARQLRDAGYVACFSLDGGQTGDYGWTIDVRDKEAGFILTDLASNKMFKVQTTDEVLARLGGKDDAQDSPA